MRINSQKCFAYEAVTQCTACSWSHPCLPWKTAFKSPWFWDGSWPVLGELSQGVPAALLTYGMLRWRS